MATRTSSLWLVGVALVLSLAVIWGATPIAAQGIAGPASSTGAATATGNSATWIGNAIAFKRSGTTSP